MWHCTQSGVFLGMSSRNHDYAVSQLGSVMQNDDEVAQLNQPAVVLTKLVVELLALSLVR